MSRDRRENLRVNDNRLITEIVSERPCAASVINLNANGLFSVKPAQIGLHGPRIVQVEIPVPEASESVWAKGQVVFEALNAYKVGSGIHFLGMADRHRRLLLDLVEMRRQEALAHIMLQMRLRKELGAHPTPFIAPPPLVYTKRVSLRPQRPENMILNYAL